MDLSLSGCGAGKARQSGSSLLFALPKRAGQKNKGRCFGKNPAKHRPSGRGPVPFAWARAHLAMFRRRKESFPDKTRRAAFPVRQKMSAVIFRTSGKFLPGHYTGLCQPLFRQSHRSGQVHHAWEQTYGRHNGQDGFHPCGTAVSADQELPAEISG